MTNLTACAIAKTQDRKPPTKAMKKKAIKLGYLLAMIHWAVKKWGRGQKNTGA